MPFISQFARVEKKWFVSSPYQQVNKWLRAHLDSALYSKVMQAFPLWEENQPDIVLSLDH
jgi:hypothetical protein